MGRNEEARAAPADDVSGDTVSGDTVSGDTEEFDPIGTPLSSGYISLSWCFGCTSTTSSSSAAIWSLWGDHCMHIHAYEKKIWLAVSVLLILFLIGGRSRTAPSVPASRW